MDTIGIILAGGNGTRLKPVTNYMSKQLIPLFDKPMIFYPLSNLMLAGIKKFIIVVKSDDYPSYFSLLQDGASLGIDIEYVFQNEPRGLADALSLCKEFVVDKFVMALGDNFLYGAGLKELFISILDKGVPTIFGVHVGNPASFGVALVDDEGTVLEVKEKPTKFYSNLAVPGYYFLDKRAFDFCEQVKPSARGELEITDVLNAYVAETHLKLVNLGRGFVWHDTGTFKDLLKVSNFIENTQSINQLKIGDIFEISKQISNY